MEDRIIQIQRIYKQFPRASGFAVEDVSIDIPRGAFVTILGTSGSGKTTLLKMINRILPLTSGICTPGLATSPNMNRRRGGPFRRGNVKK